MSADDDGHDVGYERKIHNLEYRVSEAQRLMTPFVNWLNDLDKEFADHGDDVIMEGRSEPFITFGLLRDMRRFVAECEAA